MPSECWSFHPAYRSMTHTAAFCWMLAITLIYLPSESIYSNSWGNMNPIHAFQPHSYRLHRLCAAYFNLYQPKANISKRTHSTATACDYCSSNSIKPSRHLTAPSFIMHANAWCLQRHSQSPGIPLTALIKAVAAHEKKKFFRNDLINHQTLPPTHPHPPNTLLLFILSPFLSNSGADAEVCSIIFFFPPTLQHK